MTSSATATSDPSLVGRRADGDAKDSKAAPINPPPDALRPAQPAKAAPPSSKGRAKLFVAVVVLMALSPMLAAYDPLDLLPRLPSLDWTLLIDRRLGEVAAEMDAAGEPKVMFVGGSNLLFGINPDSLSKRTGAPVLNYGLHAGLGIDLIADRASQYVRPGDVVVYAPELSHFRKGGAGSFSDDLRIDFLAAHPSPNIDPHLQSFPTRDWRRVRSRCNRLRQKLERVGSGPLSPLARTGGGGGAESDAKAGGSATGVSAYSLEAIGPRGELVAARPGPKPLEKWVVSSPPTSLETLNLTDGRGVRGFELLRKVCAERGATLCVMAPMRLDVDKYDQRAVLKMEQAWLDYARANGARVLLPPAHNVLGVNYGFDTDYHLNEAGVAAMEPRIAAALEPVLRGKSE